MLAGRLIARQKNAWRGSAIAVGDGGFMYSSVNGKSWTAVPWLGGLRTDTLTGRPASDGAGTVVVPCETNLFKSTDGGTTWSLITGHPFTGTLAGVQYVNGRWYVTDGGSDVRWTTDLINWTACTWSGGSPSIDESDGIFVFSMAYGLSTYAMFAADDGGPSYLYSSTDGTAFTRRQAVSGTTRHRGAVAYGNGHFVHCNNDGVIYESTDAVTWTSRSPAGGIAVDFHDVKYANSLFMAIGGSTQIGVQTSADGVTWTAKSSPTGPGNTLSLEYRASSTSWIAVGYDNTTGLYKAYTSTNDGVSWTVRTYATVSGGIMFGLVYDASHDKLLTIGPNISGGDSLHAQISGDGGVNWTKTYITDSGLASNISWNAIQSDDAGHWVACGSNGVLIYSTDFGATWTQAATGTFQVLYSLGYNAAMTPEWVCVGQNGATLTSSDGITWTLSTGTATQDLVDVACNGTVWCAADAGGSVWTSTNGAAWTERALSTTAFVPSACPAIAWNGTVFCAIAFGSGLRSQTSPDGITWTTRNDPTAGVSIRLYNITWADGLFRCYSDNGGDLYTSADGITWTTAVNNYTFNLSNAGFADHVECLAFSEDANGNKMFILATGVTGLAKPVQYSTDGLVLNLASGMAQTEYLRAVYAYTA